MNLFEPQEANRFVFAVVANSAREGTPPTYVSVSGGDIQTCLRSLDAAKQRNAFKHVVGRYDEEGFFCTYLPPTDSGDAGPRMSVGRFCRHPLAKASAEPKYVTNPIYVPCPEDMRVLMRNAGIGIDKPDTRTQPDSPF